MPDGIVATCKRTADVAAGGDNEYQHKFVDAIGSRYPANIFQWVLIKALLQISRCENYLSKLNCRLGMLFRN